MGFHLGHWVSIRSHCGPQFHKGEVRSWWALILRVSKSTELAVVGQWFQYCDMENISLISFARFATNCFKGLLLNNQWRTISLSVL